MIHVSFSGGMDSTAALQLAVDEVGADRVQAVSIGYGQRHDVELEHASTIVRRLGVSHRVLDLSGVLHGSALLGDGDVPHGHYEHESMAATVVHGRNLLFASALIAGASPGDEVWLGVHAGDHPVYADCRPEFVTALAAAATAYDVVVRAPWVHLSKAEIVGEVPHAPYDVTWSCYEGGDAHCGRCGTCVERAEAFTLAGITDPTTYHSTPKDNS